MADTTSPSLGDTLLNILNRGIDTAASYGVAKLQADAAEKAAKAAATPVRSDTAASAAAAAGSKAPTVSTLSSWVIPVAIGVGALALVGILGKLLFGRRRK